VAYAVANQYSGRSNFFVLLAEVSTTSLQRPVNPIHKHKLLSNPLEEEKRRVPANNN
jgi:hypothetical protein